MSINASFEEQMSLARLILFASLKLGSDYSEDVRNFACFDQDNIVKFLRSFSTLHKIETIITNGVRTENSWQYWTNISIK